MEKLTRDSFDVSLKLITEHHYTIQRLTQHLNLFKGKADHQINEGSPVIASKVERLIETARAFLKLCMSNGSAPYVTHCLAAVDYLVDPDDAIEDFTTYDGFDDDFEVFQMVIKKFDLAKLVEAAKK